MTDPRPVLPTQGAPLVEIVTDYKGSTQAMCSCGWSGPVRLFVTDTYRDAERHRKEHANA